MFPLLKEHSDSKSTIRMHDIMALAALNSGDLKDPRQTQSAKWWSSTVDLLRA